jgi:ferrous iron transport protein B
VILGMLGEVGPGALATCLGVVGAQLVLVGYLANRVLPGEPSDFIIEIPLMRLPRLTNLVTKTYYRVVWFLREAVPYFLLGTLALFLLSRLGVLRSIQAAAQPLVVHLLGLPERATPAFLVGFLRRDYGAAGLFDLRLEGLMDNVQTVVSMITMTLFVPCVAQFFIIIKEQGLRRALAIVAFVMVIAFGTGGLVNLVLRSLHVTF